MNDFTLNPRWINLASAKLGARALFASDDFFAAKERMLADAEAVFIADKYDDNGKWMDGWESRRKRIPGHDYCIVQLAKPGKLSALLIDTSHFTGNYPPAASVDAGFAVDAVDAQTQNEVEWREILPRTNLCGDQKHFFAIADNDSVVNHLRIHIYPDGGVARLRVFGTPQCIWDKNELTDLAATLNGGVALSCSDEHFGSMHNLCAPNRGLNMGDGWETARRRDGGNDWVILKLGHIGIIHRIVVDTAHFKGNYPAQCSIDGLCLPLDSADNFGATLNEKTAWIELLPPQKLSMDSEHLFADEIKKTGALTHIRLNIFPDGGISRLRLFGKIGEC